MRCLNCLCPFAVFQARVTIVEKAYLFLPPLVEILKHIVRHWPFNLGVDIVPRLTWSL